MNNKQKTDLSISKLVWEIYDLKKTVFGAQKLAEALEEKNDRKITKILGDAKMLRSFIVRRGEKNDYFDILKRSFEYLIEKRFGTNMGPLNIPEKELLEYIHALNIPEQIFNELAHVAFHRRNEKDFFRLTDWIIRNEDILENKGVVARAMHDRASWWGAHQDVKKAIEDNKLALELSNKYGEVVVVAKAKFGLSHNKGKVKEEASSREYLRPSAQANDFIALAAVLEKQGVYYDAARAKTEAAKALLKLAKRQEEKIRAETLLSAKNLALESLKSAKDHYYPNAEVQAREILAKIYVVLEEPRKEKSYQKGAEETREKFLYRTKD
jgi:hypothetical protein